MIGAASRRNTATGGLNPPKDRREYSYGKRQTCDICEVERQCIDRYGMVTCRACQTEFLPSGSVLYFG